MQVREREKEDRRDWIIVLLILLFGFLCILFASGWALRLTPSWRLDSNMESNLDPNGDFLTNKPIDFYEPLDPSILTQPVWADVFLTPGALFETRTPVSQANTPVGTNTPASTLVYSPTAVNITNTPTVIGAIPTNTPIYFPPPPSTNTPKPSADLEITKDDMISSYVPGNAVTYTITVRNNGPRNVTGAVVTDTFDTTRLNSITWTCAYTGGASSTCTGSGNINDTVNLPNSATIVYTVTANISGSASGDLVNTASVGLPAGYTDPIPGNNSATDTDTVTTVSADLSITKTDVPTSTTYTPGGSITYSIVVSNPGASTTAVTGATVTDTFDTTRLNTITWTCAYTGGASSACAGTGNINDSVNLPIGGTVTYTVGANINSGATGNLVNTATVGAPVGVFDPDTGNNTATDIDTAAPVADLSITITDNATTYEAGAIKLLPNVPPYAYIITISNAGPSNVTGATVSNVFPNGNIDTTFIAWGWTCTPSVGASCSAALGLGNLNNQSVDLNSGASVTFYLAVRTASSPVGDLVNTATVTAPGGVTDAPGNNSATDTDTPIVSSGTTYGNIGTGPGGGITTLPQNTTIILTLSSPVTKGHSGIDIIYYEEPNGIGIFMDRIVLEISDGSNWFTILNWGDGSGNAGTNINIPLPPFPLTNPSTCINEDDNCEIDATLLYGGTGITIDIDAMSWIPSGTYQYIRIKTPATDPDGAGIDGIYVVP